MTDNIDYRELYYKLEGTLQSVVMSLTETLNKVNSIQSDCDDTVLNKEYKQDIYQMRIQ